MVAKPKHVWHCGRYRLGLDRCLVMGIVNVTPDSFSDGGHFFELEAAVNRALQLIEDGADIIDVGGESARPGSEPVSTDEEISRTAPVIKALVTLFKSNPSVREVPISIDTRHPEVALAAIKAGASIINDVSGFRNAEMVKIALQTDAGLVLMHMRGTPKTMQDDPAYSSVVEEVANYLATQAMRLEWAGVGHDRILIDPGFGFGKTFDHNILLLSEIERFEGLGYPVLVGVSRKSMIGLLSGIETPAQRDAASAQVAALLVGYGAAAVRVHDVAGTVAEINRVFGSPKKRPQGKPTTAFVAMGSNLGFDGPDSDSRLARLRVAVDRLRNIPSTTVEAVATVVESEPAYLSDQPPYANTVVRLSTQLGMYALAAELRRIELAGGRTREVENGPRSIDLDLLLFGDQVSQTPELTVPHPRMLERYFVVQPLLEIAPDVTLPDGTPVTLERAQYGKVLRPLGQL